MFPQETYKQVPLNANNGLLSVASAPDTVLLLGPPPGVGYSYIACSLLFSDSIIRDVKLRSANTFSFMGVSTNDTPWQQYEVH